MDKCKRKHMTRRARQTFERGGGRVKYKQNSPYYGARLTQNKRKWGRSLNVFSLSLLIPSDSLRCLSVMWQAKNFLRTIGLIQRKVCRALGRPFFSSLSFSSQPAYYSPLTLPFPAHFLQALLHARPKHLSDCTYKEQRGLI